MAVMLVALGVIAVYYVRRLDAEASQE